MATQFDFDVQVRRCIPVLLSAGASVKFIAPQDLTVVHVSFYNQGGSAFTTSAQVTNGANTIASSSSTLAANTPEEKEGGDLSNTAISDGDTITLSAGDQPTFIVVTLSPTYTP